MRSLRAAAARSELVSTLGGKCAKCPATTALEFDCIVPQGPAHKYMPWPARVRWYWQEFLRKNLQLLCRECHKEKTRIENSKFRRLTIPCPWANSDSVADTIASKYPDDSRA